jgi:replicative DNA helicase
VYLKQNAPQQRQAETTDNFEERCRNHQAALVRCAGVADLNLAKLRFADTVTIKLKFSGARSRFDDIGGTAW